MLNRRTAIKGIGTYGALVGVSIFMPGLAWAGWNKDAFAANTQYSAMKLLFADHPIISDKVSLQAPSIVEDGELVPVTVKSTLTNVESISLFVEENATPLVAEFIFSESTLPEVRTRVRMAKTSTITAVVKAGDQLLSISQKTKVTIGGCVD